MSKYSFLRQEPGLKAKYHVTRKISEGGWGRVPVLHAGSGRRKNIEERGGGVMSGWEGRAELRYPKRFTNNLKVLNRN